MAEGDSCGDSRQPKGRWEVPESGTWQGGGRRWSQRTILLSLSLHLGQNHPSCLAYRSKVY